MTRLNLGLSRDEKHEMEVRSRIRRSPRGSYQIAVLGLKGGAGKTAVTVALGSAFAHVRGDRILVMDADSGSGNLADRVGRRTSATLADLLAHGDLSHYNDVRSYTSLNGVNLEVLAGADYSKAPRAFSEVDWNQAVELVARYYNLVLADCGASLFDPATRGVLSTVSGVVIVASASIDGARQAAVTMDWMRHNGHQDLLNRACVVINHVTPDEHNISGAEIAEEFERHVLPGRVVMLPWDKHIAAGAEIRFDLLDSAYQHQIVGLAAALSDDFERAEAR